MVSNSSSSWISKWNLFIEISKSNDCFVAWKKNSRLLTHQTNSKQFHSALSIEKINDFQTHYKYWSVDEFVWIFNSGIFFFLLYFVADRKASFHRTFSATFFFIPSIVKFVNSLKYPMRSLMVCDFGDMYRYPLHTLK